MKRNQSSTESSISVFYFAVYPLSIFFHRQYKNALSLYFEKSLQIITKFQSPVSAAKTNSHILFPPPTSVQHFRIQSQKTLEYQWSLYVHQLIDDQDIEQFIEGHKISLKAAWEIFKEKKARTQTSSLQFNTIKCRLDYLIVVGNSNKEVLETLQQYCRQNNSPPQEDIVPFQDENTVRIQIQPKEFPQQNEKGFENLSSLKFETVKQETQISRQIEQSNFPQNKPQAKVKNNYSIKVIHQQTEKIRKQEPFKQVEISKNIQSSNNLQEIEQKTQEKAYNIVDQQQTANYDQQNRLTISPQMQNKLSLSELDIGKQFEEKIQQLQNPNQGNIGTVLQQLNQLNPSNEHQIKPITLTQSQLLNTKGQVILPFYQQKRNIAIFIIVLLLIAGFSLFRLSRGQPNPQPIQNPKKAKKQKPTKQKIKPSEPKSTKKSKGKK